MIKIHSFYSFTSKSSKLHNTKNPIILHVSMRQFSRIFQKERQLKSISTFNVIFLTDCGGKRMQLNHYVKEVICVPRPTLVKLIPERGYTFYPDYAIINRCKGFCPNSKSCFPVKTNAKNIIVRRTSYNSSQCYRVSVEEHIKCK